MCGIAGGWFAQPAGALYAAVSTGIERIHHRGPDDHGLERTLTKPGEVVLGSARLAILDLSPAGHMPMQTPDGSLLVAYNGEITNYVEVREELRALGRTFASDGDTEVLLQGWSQWGQACLTRFEGMFAFAILDRANERLTLVRDAFGIKPLFYAFDGDELLFCSELPALLEMRTAARTLDWQTAFDYLQFGIYDNSDRSFVDGVNQLRPGHTITLDLATGTLGEAHRYWWPVIKTNRTISFDEAAEGVRERFLTSVRHNLRSDVPVGVALSGGIDSSAIASAIRHLEPDYPLKSFSFVSPGFTESEDEWIDLVADDTGATSYRVSSSGNDLMRDLDDLIRTQGEPFGSTSIYAQYRVFRLVREHGVVVTLDGQGADEAFAGYQGFPGYRLHSLIETGHLSAAKKFTDAWATWPGRSSSAAWWDAVEHLKPGPVARFLDWRRKGTSPVVDYAALHERGVRVSIPLLNRSGADRGVRLKAQLRSHLMERGLPSLLRHGDRNSMRYSIESRVPFLDRELIQYSLGLPEHYLVDPQGTSKAVFRKAMRGIVPDAVLDRRDKVGFSTPQPEWLSELRESSALASGTPSIGFLHPSAFGADGELPTEEQLGLGDGAHWRLLNLSRWVELFSVDAS
ncbi:MAG: asparagine synthase (glutamine-hydrolyzing) [Salinibacterium sp.]|nr:asparagine synthase (glutamine-hydrolyzing) [Salinibacterium sp.]